ncbi:MAG: serine/threonine-protein kinase, partial [Gemmatimonadales bacterium]
MADSTIPDIGKYHIIELIGEGAMGVVYKATDSVLDRTVAIKVMNESIARQDDLRKRFLHEAQAAASLQHPNVVTIYDLGDAEGHLFIAMEFVQGVDLEKLLELAEPLSLQARLDIVIDVLTGLTFAHKRGIVHRDIKPANIRVTEDGRAKIMDFGVAHLASSSMTSTGSILGTPSYMAPEQITEGKTSAATDIFAVGGVLYQLLTRMRPFDGPTLQNLFFKIITEEPKPASEMVPGLPPALDRIVAKAMAKEPSARYQNAIDMANDLSNVRSKLSGPSYPASVSLSASVSGAIESARKKAQNRSRNFAFAGGGAAVVIAVLIGWSQLVKPRASSSAAAPAADTPASVGVNASAPSIPAATGSASVSSANTSSSQPLPAPGPATPERSSATTRNTRTVTPPKVTPPKPAPRQAQTQNALVSPPTTQSAAQNPAPQQQQVVTSPPPAVVVPRPVQTQPQETAPVQPAAPSPPTTADIAPVIEAYARAIESKEIGAVRRAYPGLTSSQQSRLEDFFQSARSINARLRISSLDPSPNSAEARVVGSYEYTDSGGRPQTL